MEIITFFSFKGGVGRTQSLLNTACEFAQRGKKVVLIDFDLHAPGLSLMECMKPIEDATPAPRPGALEFFEWLVLLDEAVRRGEPPPEPINLAACAYEPVVTRRFRDGAGSFKLVPAGCLSTDCSDATDYSGRVHAVDSPLTEIIRRTHRNRERNPVVEQIRAQFSSLPEADKPDAIFIDARTGITGIADLLLTRSSDRIVLVTGLNQQNLWGLESTLRDIERSVETADWLRRITIVISPVPLGEHELTEKRTKAINDTLNRHVSHVEREMFGEIGLLPDPIQIPYDAQLALLEDPILLRHENSVPAARFRELADRLGGNVEPLQFKEATVENPISGSGDESLPQEHPLARVLPWDCGLSPEAAAAVIGALGQDSQPDKPYPGWLSHALNYLANSPALANTEPKARQSLIRNLPRSPIANRVSLLRSSREERQHLFSAPKAAWSQLAGALGAGRVSWLHELSTFREGIQAELNHLVSEGTSGALWGSYWTGIAEALRLLGKNDEAVGFISVGSSKLEGRGDFVRDAIQILMRISEWDKAIALADLSIKATTASASTLADALFLKAATLNMMGRVDEAAEVASEAANIYCKVKDRHGEANALRTLGEVLARTGQLEAAQARIDEALQIFREVKGRLGEANALRSLGEVLARTDQLEAAQARYDEALQIYREVKGRLGEANTLQSLGNLLVRTDKPEEARARFDKALSIYREVKDRLGEANTLQSLGILLVRTDEPDEARASFDDALQIFREVKDRLGEANTLRALGNLLVRTDKLQEARIHYNEALPIYRVLKVRLGEANALNSLGDLLVRIDELDEARGRLAEALLIYREVKSRLGEANTLLSLGDLLVRTDKQEDAQVRFDEALPIFREVRDHLGEANTLKSKGDLLVRTDRLSEARARYEEALLIFRKIKSRLGEAFTLNSMGHLLVRTDRLGEARARLDEALLIFREVKSRLGEGITLGALGDLLVRTDKLEEAQARYHEALIIFREIKVRRGEAYMLQGLGTWHLARREFDACQNLVDDCLQRYAELSDPEGRFETLLLSSRLLQARGETEKAVAVANQLIGEARDRGHLLLAREADEWLKSLPAIR